jgi:hypothetical protein
MYGAPIPPEDINKFFPDIEQPEEDIAITEDKNL